MLYRVIITVAVVLAVLGGLALKQGESEHEQSPVAAPAAVSNPDEAKFKGLTIN